MKSLQWSLFFLSFYVIYLLAGSILFKAIECPQEVAVKWQIAKEEEELMFVMAEAFKNLDDELAQSTEASITLIRHQLSRQLSKRRVQKKEIVCETWSTYNSMFFAFTSITTIGYGNVTPQTQLGRGACLAYCIVGIPTNSIFICLIGNLFIKQESKSKSAEQTYHRIRKFHKVLVTEV